MTTLLLLVALLLVPVVAEAITVTPNGVTSDVQYVEPSTNADGTPLTDLDHCNVYATPATGAEVKFPNVAASSPTGGATKTTNITVAKGSNYTITASCTDLVGNESARSASVTLDALPPAAPR